MPPSFFLSSIQHVSCLKVQNIYLINRSEMTIEVGRFPDKRLKAIRKLKKTDSNVRVNEDEVTVVSKIDEVELEKDVIEAVNLWNLMHRFPELRSRIEKILECYFNGEHSSQGERKDGNFI